MARRHVGAGWEQGRLLGVRTTHPGLQLASEQAGGRVSEQVHDILVTQSDHISPIVIN